MKKIILLLIFLFLSTSAFAQLAIESSQSIYGVLDVKQSTTTETTVWVSIGQPLQVVGLTVMLDLNLLTSISGTGIDIYLTTSDNEGLFEYDVVHFPTIIATGAKTYVAKVSASVLPQTVTGATATNDAILRTESQGANQGARTLAANSVRHGVTGTRFRLHIVHGSSGNYINYRVKVIQQ